MAARFQRKAWHEAQLSARAAHVDHLTAAFGYPLVAAAWQFRRTTDRAEEVFDRGLLSAALAISRQVALSDGDAISFHTKRLAGDTSGGPVFYHGYAPDAVFVTAYSTPPVLPSALIDGPTEPQY